MISNFQERLRRYEIISFQKYCRRKGVDPEEEMNDLIDDMKFQLEGIANKLSLYEVELLDISDALVKINKLNNYWQIIEGGARKDYELALNLIQQFFEEAASFELDEEYLNKIGKVLDLGDGVPLSNEMILQILKNVPVGQKFENFSNAYVSMDTETGFPYILLNHSLHSTIHNLSIIISSFCAYYDHENKKMHIEDVEKLKSVERLELILPFLRYFFEIANGNYRSLEETSPEYKRLSELYELANTKYNNPVLQGSLYQGAITFIWLHEIAHILRGHIDQSEKAVKAQEFEADDFAINVLLHTKSRYLMVLAGVNFLFRILNHIEISESSEYPSSDERLDRINTTIKNTLSEDHFSKYLIICRTEIPLMALN